MSGQGNVRNHSDHGSVDGVIDRGGSANENDLPVQAGANETAVAAISERKPMDPVPFRVMSATRETKDVVTLELEPPGDHARFPFAPGQFTMLYAFGVGEVPISISGDPSRPQRLVHTVRDVGAVSGAICRAKRGDYLGVRGPFGSSWPVDEMTGRDVVLVAGGIGLAPLRPAFLAAMARRSQLGRLSLLYGARSPAELLFVKELERVRGRFDVQVEVTVDTALEDWRGAVGPVTYLVRRAHFDPDESIALVCGPEIMMRFAVQELLGRGVPAERIYISAERNMKCAVGLCGHCQLGSLFICKDGPVFPYPKISPLLLVDEL